MPNELFNQMNGVQPQMNGAQPQMNAVQPQMNDGGFSQLIAEVRRMQQTFKGDPRATVQQLISSGQMTQEQFNQYAQLANQIVKLM